jgi:branched-subunit amino acid aminotransferase/4-amino-4-deoxychorismate lyase
VSQLLYNGQLFPEEELQLPLSNRAFQYNDGFFETLIMRHYQIRFWPDHWDRIQEAAQALQLSLPPAISLEAFPLQVQRLAAQFKGEDLLRMKLKVWRAGAGLYTPETDQADWLLTAQPTSAPSQDKISVGICESVRTIPSVFSAFKGINSPVYVLASREKAARRLDDLVLLDPLGKVAELTYSNLFWGIGTTLYTPSLDTGCLNGIARRNLVRLARQQSVTLKEGKFSLESLYRADVVFGANVTGIRYIQQIEQQPISGETQLSSFLEKAEKLFQ